jgi:hypothetical protein
MKESVERYGYRFDHYGNECDVFDLGKNPPTLCGNIRLGTTSRYVLVVRGNSRSFDEKVLKFAGDLLRGD